MEQKDEIEAETLTSGHDLADKFQSPTDETTPTQTAHPFKKWMDTFRTRKYVPSSIPERFVEGWPDATQTNNAHLLAQDPQWERSSGHSSHLGLKTTTMSTASQSEARSRGTTHSTTTQSVLSDVRASGDSSRPSSSHYVDEAAVIRATKRRLVLQELVTTEDDYVLGLKALTGVLSIFSARAQIQRNIQQICHIHESFQGRLQDASPLSSRQDTTEASDFVSRGLSKRLGGIDLRGLKSLPSRSLRTRSLKAAVDQRRKSLVADPFEVLEVAREIDRLSASFSAYEEFCSNYDLLSQDVAILRRSIPNWSVYDQGIEALSKSVASVNSRRNEENKSMSMGDLMIKVYILTFFFIQALTTQQPIQRLCKYPLLLQDLLRYTPVSDCPTSHDAIRQILDNIRTLVTQINSATGNPVNKDRIHKTLLLQEKIRFADSFMLQDVYKDLGPMILCGVLHVTYQTSELITGDFMVCVLFNSYFLIAKVIDDSHRLEVVACIYMDDLKMDTIQNGRGIYCYGCPFSWKIIFQDQEENFEFVLSASSAAEEKHWKTDTLKCSAALAEMGKSGTREPRKYSLLALLLVPLDRANYTVASLARRSMDAVAISRKSTSQHVVIRKTRCPQTHDESTESSSEIERPNSPIARTPWVVTARRMDRIRLERLISEVYTRDVLPWPGMVLGRGDLLFGRGSIMRHLSLHKGFAKRSISVSTSHSGPVVTESHAVDDYNGEEKELVTSQDGCGDQQSPITDCESPKTPISTMGRSKTVRFGGTAKKSLSLPREKRPSQDDNLELSPRKKWSSPMTLLSALSPKNLIRSRAETGTEE
ncbi:uncharacterized protein N7484_006942 [Penicillium longicatenatum]|uniref:uncharacterized protein n=1 Tax=Penicillium longicatenatum TaxID=1561947 RepID=UPI0025484C1F|nr:uncharacterized protein N7484_006942 [Penicillium longicatenatum]KAJ5639080.1 hypothetical protein N7484_006942 [Penicillium longicatenatum]